MFDDPAAWSNNWAWGLPLIVLTVLVHAFGLALTRDHVVLPLSRTLSERRSASMFAVIVAATALLLTTLHALEGAAWAFAYFALSARPDLSSAMLYSLSAMTAYGHANIFLAKHWQLMGALEALNGMMLFGLSTAFLFWTLQTHWPARARL